MMRITLYTLFPMLAMAAAQPACCRGIPESNTCEELADPFATVGFQLSADDRWVRSQEDPPTLSYVPGRAGLQASTTTGLPGYPGCGCF